MSNMHRGSNLDMNNTKSILFCLPFAGGSAATYKKWKNNLDDTIELHAIELTGRGSRHRECFSCSIAETVDDIFPLIIEVAGKTPYAIFGHSMGSLIAFELCKKIAESKGPMPQCLFLSVYNPPHMEKGRNISELPLEKLKEEIFKLGGTPKEVIDSKELIDYFLPIIRADFKICDTYKFSGDIKPLSCDIIALNGKTDPYTNFEIMKQWDKYTIRDFEIHSFDGGHFFIHYYMGQIVNIINRTMKEKNG